MPDIYEGEDEMATRESPFRSLTPAEAQGDRPKIKRPAGAFICPTCDHWVVPLPLGRSDTKGCLACYVSQTVAAKPVKRSPLSRGE